LKDDKNAVLMHFGAKNSKIRPKWTYAVYDLDGSIRIQKKKH